MEKLDLTGLKNEALIIKGKMIVIDHMNEEQKTELLKEIKADMDKIIKLINIEIEIENDIRNSLFNLANRI